MTGGDVVYAPVGDCEAGRGKRDTPRCDSLRSQAAPPQPRSLRPRPASLVAAMGDWRTAPAALPL